MTQVDMLGSYILIQKDRPQEKRSPGGIVLPAPVTANPTWASVVAVGDEVGTKVKAGDRILVSKFAGADVLIGEDTCFVVRLEDVYGIERSDG
jgi:co-chaperonin GroES (HSP10)